MLKKPSDFSFLILGGVTDTYAIYNNGPKKRFGGGMIFGSLTGLKLGVKMTGVTIGADDIEPGLELVRTCGMEIKRVKRQKSNNNYNDYTVSPPNLGVSQYFKRPMTAQEIPKLSEKFSSVFVFPLLDEISPQVVAQFSSISSVFLDASGYTRRILTRNKNQVYPVVQKHWDSIDQLRGLVKILKLSDVDIDKISFPKSQTSLEDKIKHLCGHGFPITIMTRGKQPTLVGANGVISIVPTYPVDQVIDVAGAGEAFCIGFMLEYLITGSSYRAALFANCCAAFHICRKPFNYDIISQAIKSNDD